MQYSFKPTIIALFLSFSFTITYGQHLKESAISHYKKSYTPSYQNKDLVVLNLPFFDDFSSADTLSGVNWVTNQGTYINNGFVAAPPSLNVATFDGLNQSGMPYETENLFAFGFADSLTSQCIDLSTSVLGDSIYLSFYWQAQGLAELPDENDSLSLFFKNVDGEWDLQWSAYGNESLAFEQTLIAVNDVKYMHAAFQFRLINTAKLSGLYDIWNVDYFYLNSGRNFQDTGNLDVATSVTPSQLLVDGLSAMPMEQFEALLPNVFVDTVYTTVNNFTNTGSPLPVGHKCYLYDDYELGLLDSFSTTSITGAVDASLLPLETQQFEIKAITSTDALVTADSLLLRYQFDYNTNFDNVIDNDTIYASAVINNYYAYDDGSAESSLGLTQPLAKLALKYTAHTPSYISSIRIYFPYSGEDLYGNSYQLAVWQDIDTLANSAVLLNSKSVFFEYTDERNEFVELSFPPTYVSGDFYVGVIQSDATMLGVGFDKNNNSADNIFYNVNNKWYQNTDSELQGSLMIRPIFDEVDVSAIDEYDKWNVLVYPTKVEQVIKVESAKAISEYQITNIHGQAIQKEHLAEDILNFSISLKNNALPSGIYFLRMYSKTGELKVVRFIKK